MTKMIYKQFKDKQLSLLGMGNMRLPTKEVVGTSSSTGYGVYADTVYNDGRIRIRRRYNSVSSLTIDGTYKVEVYLLDPVGGVSIFT